MDVALDQLESLWPPYRGSVLLGAARVSQGRICNAGIAVTAGHVAISLDVHPDRSTATAVAPTAVGSQCGNVGTRQCGDDTPLSAGAAAGVDDAMSPSLRLTVLLDAVPGSAPKPGTQQLARFLTKLLGRSAVGMVHVDDRGGSRLARREGGLLGADVPEMLVVEHVDEVVCSEFVRFDHRPAESGTTTAEGASGGTSSSGRGDSSSRRSGLAYACIEASGLLRLWEWRGTEGGRWAWSYLNSCNICACRDEPVGCRVLTAAIVPEPCDGEGKGSDNRRHRLVWEQEDSGEGAGLGLASTPAAGPRLPRRVWSRRITLDISEGGSIGDGGFSFPNHHPQQQHPNNLDNTGGVGFGSGDATGAGGDGGGGGGGGGSSSSSSSSSTRSEISLAFSACLLPTRVDALLCSRLGAWMPTGQRVYFNHFATGRLPCVTLPGLLPRDRGGIGTGCSEPPAAESADDSFGPDANGGAAGRGDSAPFPDESGLEIEGAPDAGDNAAGAEQTEAFATGPMDGRDSASEAVARCRLFSVHDSTGDLMVYDHHPCATVRVLSLSSGPGGLSARTQCTLDPPPPPASPPGSFAARSNVAVFCGGGLCSVYDLCTGRMIGSAAIPRCSTCVASRRRRRSKTATSVASPCTCGRRQQARAASEPLHGGRADAAAAGPGLWTSATRGHLLGVLTATQVLRVRIPRAEACLTATLVPPLRGVTLPPPSAPSALRYLREYRRLAVGTADGAWPSSPLPELLRTAQQQERAGAATIPDDGGREARTGASMMGLIGHALSAEERGFPVAAGGVLGTANGSSVRKDTPVPPWLLTAMVSASQNQGTGGGSEAVGGMGAPPSFAGGDPATAATEVGLRNALERRVEGSLRSLNSVRALLQDPAGSARQGAADSGSGSGSRSGADDEVVARLAALTADVDPATALFEGTLREWLACRQRGKGGGDGDGDGEQYGPRHHGGSRFGGGGMRDSGLGWGGGGGSRAVANNDDLALAFRCEAAGDSEAMEIPFLNFLMEVSGEADPGREEKRTDSETPLGPFSSAYSTFLCLQLAGDGASPLFEIACRALFRLRPQKLARFVERLARFRAYANEIKREGCAAGAAGVVPQDADGNDEDREGKEDGEEEREDDGQSQRQGTLVSSADSRSERTSGGDTARSEEQQRHRRSPSPPPQSGIASRRTSEDAASEHGGRDSRSTTRQSSTVTSREHSPEPPPPPLPAPAVAAATGPPPIASSGDTKDDLPDPTTPPPSASRQHPEYTSHEHAEVAPAHFARALASLPPAAEDDRVATGAGCRQRRARLSLLLGACRFAEACGLLRSRAWQGSGSSPGGKRGGSWRRDRGGEEAWRAAMRLLNELRLAVAVTDKGGEDAAPASGADATAAAAAAAAATVGAGVPLPLQFRLAFEDALAETILADSPERMEAVMLCRPEGLTPVAVVRMVRRAAREAAETSAGAGAGGDGTGGSGGNQAEPRSQRFLSGSTQTLKMCLLLLLEDGARQEVPAV